MGSRPGLELLANFCPRPCAQEDTVVTVRRCECKARQAVQVGKALLWLRDPESLAHQQNAHGKAAQVLVVATVPRWQTRQEGEPETWEVALLVTYLLQLNPTS